MHTRSKTTVLLFVVMDGWSTLIHGLVMTYK